MPDLSILFPAVPNTLFPCGFGDGKLGELILSQLATRATVKRICGQPVKMPSVNKKGTKKAFMP